MRIDQLTTSPISFEPYDITKMLVISGGQNGADQAGLRAAWSCDISQGGWAPNGWITQDGPQHILLSSFNLKECQIPGYPPRTELNVKDSQITLRFAGDFGSAGEKCTYRFITKHKKPHVDLNVPEDLTDDSAVLLAEYLMAENLHVINVAGNSEKTCPGIGTKVEIFLQKVFTYVCTYASKDDTMI